MMLSSWEHGEMIHTTGVLHWITINSFGEKGQEGEAEEWPFLLGSLLIVLSRDHGGRL